MKKTKVEIKNFEQDEQLEEHIAEKEQGKIFESEQELKATETTNVESEKNEETTSSKMQINLSKYRGNIVSGSILFSIGLLLFLGCFIWTFIADSTIELTRLERAVPMIVMLVSLFPIAIGLALIIIANKKWKSVEDNFETKTSQKEKTKTTKKMPKRNRNPRLGEIAYWRIDEDKAEEETPFDYVEVSLNQKKEDDEK
jgi:hypothetical protein